MTSFLRGRVPFVVRCRGLGAECICAYGEPRRLKQLRGAAKFSDDRVVVAQTMQTPLPEQTGSSGPDAGERQAAPAKEHLDEDGALTREFGLRLSHSEHFSIFACCGVALPLSEADGGAQESFDGPDVVLSCQVTCPALCPAHPLGNGAETGQYDVPILVRLSLHPDMAVAVAVAVDRSSIQLPLGRHHKRTSLFFLSEGFSGGLAV